MELRIPDEVLCPHGGSEKSSLRGSYLCVRIKKREKLRFVPSKKPLRGKWLFVKELFFMLDVIELEEKVQNFVEERGFNLVDFQVASLGRAHTYKLFLERLNGEPADLNDCTWLSPMVEAFLEAQGVYEENSVLEVSSPGLDRAIKKDKDFERYSGRNVRVTVFSEGRKLSIVGRLKGIVDGNVAIYGTDFKGKLLDTPGVRVENEVLFVPRELVERVRLKPEI